MTRPSLHALFHPHRRAWCLLAMPALLAGCQPARPPAWTGYVEGDFLYVSSPVGGLVRAVDVQKGARVAAGAPLFELEGDAEAAAKAGAAERLAAAQAQARDLQSGKRAPEVDVTRAQLAQAVAAARLADDDWSRQRDLQRQGFVAAARVDEAATVRDQAHQRVRELEAQLGVARLPARDDARRAAVATAAAAEQSVREADWRTRQKRQYAPAPARVTDVFLQPGEYAAPGQPVLSLLPDGQVRARFYVGEPEVATLPPGTRLRVRCDGCGAPVAAQVSWVAPEPEYTPPVIYSNENRRTLVFLVEARLPPADAMRFRPGQPIEVTRDTGRGTDTGTGAEAAAAAASTAASR